MSEVKAKDFHPMHGHVEHGATVIFCDGSKMTIENTIPGWCLVSGGKKAAGPISGAYELAGEILNIEKSKFAIPQPISTSN